MNAAPLPSRQRPRRAGLVLAVILSVGAFLAPGTVEAAPQPQVGAPPAVVVADWKSVLGDRSRMIQVAVVVMCIGIAFLMWGKTE